MEKIVIFALVILSCVTLSSGSDHSPSPSPPAPKGSPTTSKTPSPSSSAGPPGPGPQPTTKAPTSGAVSFTASAGLIVSLVMALLH